MPPKLIDGIYDPPQLFYCDGDGNYIPLNKIQQINFRLEMTQDPSFIEPNFTPLGELTFTAKFTPHSSRRIKKMFRSVQNKIRRLERSARRHEEKQRRNRLKGETA